MRATVCAMPADAVNTACQQLFLRGVLHDAAVMRLFCNPASSFRFHRVGSVPFEPREVLGLTRDLHGAYKAPCHVVVAPLPDACDAATMDAFRQALLAVNKLEPRPAAVVVVRSASTAPPEPAKSLRQCFHAVADDIPLVFTGGAAAALGAPSAAASTVPSGEPVCPAPLVGRPGTTYFGAWVGGARILAMDNRGADGVDDTPQYGT